MLGGNWDSSVGLYAQDYVVQWFEAPADLTIKAIACAFSDNEDYSLGSLIIYKVGNGITWNDLANVGPSELKQGRFVAAHPYYFLGYVGFENESDGSGYINVGNLPDFPFADFLWDMGFQGQFEPVASPSSDPYYHFFETVWYGHEPTVFRGEIFAIVFKNDAIMGNTGRIGIWAKPASSNPDCYGWKFNTYGKSANDTSTAYWYSLEYILDFAVIVDFGDDCYFRFYHTPQLTTLNTEPIPVSVTVYGPGDNPMSVSLNYNTDNGSVWHDVIMNNISNNDYETIIPGFMPGTKITYFFTAYESSDTNCHGKSEIYSYTIYKKQNDVLFIYNSSDFTTTTAKKLYIGNPAGSYIVDPIPNDVWLSYDTAETAEVMSLYNWVIQVDGSYPNADLSVAAKTYLEGASPTSPRAYFLSSQDYGCLLTGTCKDTNFTAGDFQYDYLGINTLGLQNFTSDSGVKVEISPVVSDPLSDWVADYNSANLVSYWYDPTYLLGFTGHIDAITTTPSAQTIFATGDYTVGIRNEGPNWKASFITFDYAGCNFRSDTSLTPENDPKYAWGIEIGNQALEFLQWAGYDPTDVESITENSPEEFKLLQNYPNPFNPTTNIGFRIANLPDGKSGFGLVTLKVFDVLGREVATLVNEEKLAGEYEVEFDGSNLPDGKAGLSSGIYFYMLRTGNYSSVKKMILLK
ncbi:MAG: hypothetical protein A2080_12260 [Ignavibacteria bacterium GWC2_36_12]|nr:MAG: hypothetical protein A2080_12260 [Ignavibacteria bacterium GWC2_36_12]